MNGPEWDSSENENIVTLKFMFCCWFKVTLLTVLFTILKPGKMSIDEF